MNDDAGLDAMDNKRRFIFRGNAEPGYECKHVAAVLKFIGRQYLKFEYDPRRQMSRVA